MQPPATAIPKIGPSSGYSPKKSIPISKPIIPKIKIKIKEKKL